MAIWNNLRRRARSPLRIILKSSKKAPSGPLAFPFANAWMTSVSSCIVGLTPRGVFSGHWSRPSSMFGSSFGDLTFFRRVCNYRAQRSRMSPPSLRSVPSSSLRYAELWFPQIKRMWARTAEHRFQNPSKVFQRRKNTHLMFFGGGHRDRGAISCGFWRVGAVS